MEGFLRYDTRLKERARQNRKNPTEAEKIAWENIFSNKQLGGFKFTRQKMLSGFIVDFYCSALQLVVEIDGEIHNDRSEYDEERTTKLTKLGLRVVRYKNEDILQNPEKIIDDITTKYISSIPPDKGARGLE